MKLARREGKNWLWHYGCMMEGLVEENNIDPKVAHDIVKEAQHEANPTLFPL